MSPLLLPALLLVRSEPSPHAYKPVVGERATYAARYGVKTPDGAGTISHRLDTEVLSVEADGTAELRFSFANLKQTGIAKDQPFPGEDATIRMDQYGRFTDASGLASVLQLLNVAFALPDTELDARTWLPLTDPMSQDVAGMVLEGRLKERKGTRLVFVVRSQRPAEGQSFNRETSFDSAMGRLLSVRLRGTAGDGVRVELDLDRRESRR